MWRERPSPTPGVACAATAPHRGTVGFIPHKHPLPAEPHVPHPGLPPKFMSRRGRAGAWHPLNTLT